MRKRFKESEIINLLRAIEVKTSGGMGTTNASMAHFDMKCWTLKSFTH